MAMEGRPHGQRNQNGDNPPIKGGGKRKNRDARRDQRREDAFNRQLVDLERSDFDRYTRLVEAGHGRCAEARKLVERHPALATSGQG